MRTKISIEKIIHLSAFPLFFGLIFLLYYLNRELVHEVFLSPETVRDWVNSFGVTGPLVFVLAQFLQVVIFVIPGEVTQIAGGYLFGVWQGLLLSLIGILAGSLFNFFVARTLGKLFVQKVFGETRLANFERVLNSSKTWLVFFLLFLIPGIPKDVLCYFAGLSVMTMPVFMLISMIGRFPALLGSVVIGDAVSRNAWPLAVTLIVVATVLFLAGFIYRERIQQWIKGLGSKKTAR